MVYEFKLPDIGEGVHEGEISRWLVEVGQSVKEEDPMVEIMTDKVTAEITCPTDGTIQELCFKEGDLVKVGQVIVRIDESGSGSVTKSAKKEATQDNGGGSTLPETPPSVPETAPSAPKVTTRCSVSAPAAGGRGKVLAAPAVRKLARSMGVDLTMISGSGPKGRIRKDDVMAQAQGGGTATMAKPIITGATPEQRVSYKGMRRKIGDHLVKSKHTAPHFSYVEEADLSALVSIRNDLKPMAEERGVKLTYLPFIMKAVIEGMKQYPVLNSTLDETAQEIVLKGYYNIGVAVATDQGLVVPVVHHAHEKSIWDIARDIDQLSAKARNNQLALEDVQGGTFTLTSIGSIGGIFSAPIINYPEVGIMGIQKVEKRPVVHNDEIVIREMCYLSISCDHRVVDGAEAALFMKAVIDWLEHPARLLAS